MPLPGLASDTVVISRSASTVDTEGNYTGTLAVVATVRGTYGNVSTTDAMQAGQRGDIVDAVVALATGVDVRMGDVIDLRGQRWVVTAVRDVRTHQRALIRQDIS